MINPIVEQFINGRENESLKGFENRIFESLNNTANRLNLYHKWMFGLVLIHFLLLSSNEETSISLLGISIKDLKVVGQAVPAFISVLFAFYIKQMFFRNELEITYRKVFAKLNHIEFGGPASNAAGLDQVTGLIIPYKPLYELMEIKGTDKGCMSALVKFILTGIPILVIQIVPLLFVVYGVLYNFRYHWHENFGKLCTVLAIWGLLYGIFLFLRDLIKYVIKGVKANQNA
ncbi:hypothetical protein [Parapedobacter tibetensis]|uniref:hypothetical protein n=1 Tax=Parapedobacter tibetensis TaxID=2972951 RepID=UPI00214D9331|nr:hypothetical protein [Parapedobacter tibetensis]